MLRYARDSYRRFQNCSRLGIIRSHYDGARKRHPPLTVTQTVGPPAIGGEEIHGVVLRHILWILLDEVGHCTPEGWNGLHIFQHREGEA